MSITHSINGIEFYGIQAPWTPGVLGRNNDNTKRFSDSATLQWTTATMDTDTFLTLQDTATNKTITELKTNLYEDRNAQGTYTSVEVQGVVGGGRFGNRVNNVSVNFRVVV